MVCTGIGFTRMMSSHSATRPPQHGARQASRAPCGFAAYLAFYDQVIYDVFDALDVYRQFGRLGGLRLAIHEA